MCRTSSKQLQGSLLLHVGPAPYSYQSNNRELSLSDLVTTHTVKDGYDFGARLPKRILIQGERYCADICFRGSALFSEASQSLPYAAAVARIENDDE